MAPSKEARKDLAVVIPCYHLDKNEQIPPHGLANTYRGIALAKYYGAQTVVLSGGNPTGWGVEAVKYYKKFERDLAGLDVLPETDSENTIGNAYYTIQYLRQKRPEVRELIVVSTTLNFPRVKDSWDRVNRICGSHYDIKYEPSSTDRFLDNFRLATEPFSRIGSTLALRNAKNERDLKSKLEQGSSYGRVSLGLKKKFYRASIGT